MSLFLEETIVDYDDRALYHSGGTSGLHSARKAYSELMDSFDELGQLDDKVPMSAQTPTEFTLTNSWFMDYEKFKYITGGAIVTDGWDCSAVSESGIRILDFSDLETNFVISDTGLYVTGGTSNHSGVLLAYDNTLKRIWVRIEDTGNLFDESTEDVGVDGGAGSGVTSQASRTGENLWPNIYTLGTITGGTNLYIIQTGLIIDPWWGTGHIDVLPYVKEAGTEIDNAIVTIFDRKWGALFDNFQIDLTNGGRNAVPLATSNDVNNTGVEGTVSGYTDISFTFGPTAKNLNNGAGDRPYDVVIDLAGTGVYNMYEYTKFVCRSGSVYELSGLSGDRYRYLKGGDLGESKQAQFGSFAGGKFFGARGVWIENYDANDAQNFQLIDSSGDTQIPPNTVTVEITDLESGTKCAVYKLHSSTGDINFTEYSGTAANLTASEILYVQGTISGDTPQDGWVAISGANGDGVYEYTAWETGEFNITTALGKDYAVDDPVYIPIIYTGAVGTSVQQTFIYSSDFPIVMRGRLKGYLPWEARTTVTNAGRSLPMTKITDSIAT